MWKYIEFIIPSRTCLKRHQRNCFPMAVLRWESWGTRLIFLLTMAFVFWLLKMCICYILIKISKCAQRSEICSAQMKRSGWLPWRTGSLRSTLSYGTCTPLNLILSALQSEMTSCCWSSPSPSWLLNSGLGNIETPSGCWSGLEG